ncbi:S9 family peptidase [Sanguibacteroides sp. AM78-02pH3A]|uniref:S9 family peptidase n=1 Tax=Sanguibacteroides sp. AM78-02pH3A TaxID=3002646 RepID=UPI002FD85005
MMMRCFLWLFPCFFVLICTGQQANYKRAEQFMRGRGNDLIGSTKVEPRFLKESDKFWFTYKTGDGLRYYFVDPKARKKQELFDRDFMARELSKIIHKPMNSKNLTLQNIRFKKDEKTMTFQMDTFAFSYDIFARRLVKLDSLEKEEKSKSRAPGLIGSYSPDSTYVVYAKKHNLYAMRVKDSVETQLTTDGEIYHSYAYAEEDTSAQKMAAKIVWFKNSNRFYVRRSDDRKVNSLFVVNVLGERPRLQKYKYVFAGDEHVTQYDLSVFDVDAKKQIRVPIEKWKDQKLSVLYVAKKTDKFYVQRKKRTCDELDICEVDAITGEVKVLINETDKPYFNDDFYHISFLNDGEDIIWWSERTGHGHFYHYDGGGNLKNEITSGEWTAGKMIKIDTVHRTMYFAAYGQVKGEPPYYARINKADIDGKKGVEILTPEMATHAADFSPSGRYFVDNYSRADLEPRSVLRDNRGKVVFELPKPDLSRLYETGWKMPEPFTVKAADGVTDLYGFMWKPFDFDSTKTYPVISYVYPGPQTEAFPLVFSVTSVYNAGLAQVGFVVVSFGHRGGTPLRDKWYHTFGYGNLRDYPLADDKYGIEQLASRHPFIDISRVGIFGHSGGGFMSTAALCTYPDFYTAAVSSAGNHDNNIYNQWWGETHHGIKEEVREIRETVKDSLTGKDTTIVRRETYFKTRVPTNIELAKQLRGYLLLVTGDVDNNVHPGNTLRMADALLKAGKNFDLVVLPGIRHGFSGIQDDFFQRKMWFHFAKHLLGDYTSETYREIDEYNRKK